MEYLKKYKIILVCLAVGFFIAILTRGSFFVFTKDFSYYEIGGFAHPAPKEFGDQNLGKKVIGQSGFPFPAYSDCKIDFHGTMPSPACSFIFMGGASSIFFNTVFWSLLCYLIWLLVKSLKRLNF